jgi:uroporphyrinogen-III synthase
VQVIHLFQIAEEMHLRSELEQALRRFVVVSVGPTTTEECRHYGVQPDFEPSRPRMGFMINEAAQYAGTQLSRKRSTDHQVFAAPRSIPQVASSTSAMAGFRDALAPVDPLHGTLSRIVSLASAIVPCDACHLYTIENDHLVLRASNHPDATGLDNLRLPLSDATAWALDHRNPVSISERAGEDPRMKAFTNPQEDRFEAVLCMPLTCGDRVVGLLSLQHREPYRHSDRERDLLATVGALAGAEIERLRLEAAQTPSLKQFQI